MDKPNHRKYYLLKRIKKFVAVREKNTIFLHRDISLNRKQLSYISALRFEYGYCFEKSLRKIRTRKDNRRYYLHQKVKHYVTKRNAKILFVHFGTSTTEKVQSYLNALQTEYGYSIQTEL